MTRFASVEAKENPMTPQGMLRNISFSPRLQFYDTWPSAEYDRRGEIATCNRLTPMLAQQIKEELNTFKMVRTPRELSRGAILILLGNGSSRILEGLHTLLLMAQIHPWISKIIQSGLSYGS